MSLTERKNLWAEKKSRNTKGNVAALVLANGPSLNKLNIKTLASLQQAGQLEVFGVNFFPLGEVGLRVKLNFLTLSDPETKPSHQSLANKRLWNHVRSEPKLKLICPTSWSKELSGASLPNKIFYFDDRSLEGWSRNISPLRPRGYITMTAFKALAFAVHLGYDSVFLLGFDNDMFRGVEVDGKNRIIENPWHSIGTDGGREAKELKLEGGLSDYFYVVSKSFQDLRLFSRIKTVTNLDPSSLVDCFEKISDESQGWYLTRKS